MSDVPAAPHYAPIPAASTGMPPKETWLPRKLTDDEKAHRAAADRFLMRSTSLRAVMSNTTFLQGELTNRQYDALESQLDAAVAKLMEDPAYEITVRDMIKFTEGGGQFQPADKFLLDEWVKERPASPWAHYSEGLRWLDMAWQIRGDGWAKDVPADRWRKIERDIANARAELHKALKLNPGIPEAWVTLQDIDRADGDLATVTRDYRDGAAHYPAGYLLAYAYEFSLTPKWYGSHEQMDAFAQQLAGKIDANPRFWALQGEAAADKGCSRCNNYDWSTGLTQYNRALAYADDPGWLSGAGEAAVHLHRYALAYRYYERASKYDKNEFQYVMEMSLMQAICDPKEDAFELKVDISNARIYAGIPEMDYPRVSGDCTYYQSELPWGDEPVPDIGTVASYDVHMMQVMASFKQKH